MPTARSIHPSGRAARKPPQSAGAAISYSRSRSNQTERSLPREDRGPAPIMNLPWPASGLEAPLLPHPRIDQLVDRPLFLRDAFLQSPFQDIPRFFQDPHRGAVPVEDPGVDPAQVERREPVIGQPAQRLGCNAAPPEWLAEPVADLGRPPEDIVPELQSDSADRLAVDHDGELRLREQHARLQDPSLRIDRPIRRWKSIAQGDPDFSVVGVPDQGKLVARLPIPEEDTIQFDLLHRLHSLRPTRRRRGDLISRGAPGPPQTSASAGSRSATGSTPRSAR